MPRKKQGTEGVVERGDGAPPEPDSRELFDDDIDTREPVGDEGSPANEPGDEDRPAEGSPAEGSPAEGSPADEPVAARSVNQLGPEEIRALLAKRRAEFEQVQAVAREKGVVKGKGKAATDDADKLLDLFNRLGYSAGMRWWAQGRMNSSAERIGRILPLLGEGWDGEKQEDARVAMASGYREARVQTSFASQAMPDKKAAADVPVADVWEELARRLEGATGDAALVGWLRELVEA